MSSSQTAQEEEKEEEEEEETSLQHFPPMKPACKVKKPARSIKNLPRAQKDGVKRKKRGRPRLARAPREYEGGAARPLSKTREKGIPSIIPGHHQPVPAFGQPSAQDTTLPLSISAALDHINHGVRDNERHAITLPAEFGLDYVVAEVAHTKGRIDTYILDTRVGKAFRSLPKFIKHLRDTDVNTAQLFYIEEYIDSARKQIGFQYRKKHKVNPDLPNEFACTPDCVYNFLKDEWYKEISEFDPAPRNPTFDGLEIDWVCEEGRTVYVNPPFRHMKRWTKKVVHEVESGRVKDCVLMMPGRTNPNWFHHEVLKYATRIVVSRNSLRFKGYKHHIPTGVLLAEFKYPLKENTEGTRVFSARLHDWD